MEKPGFPLFLPNRAITVRNLLGRNITAIQEASFYGRALVLLRPA